MLGVRFFRLSGPVGGGTPCLSSLGCRIWLRGIVRDSTATPQRRSTRLRSAQLTTIHVEQSRGAGTHDGRPCSGPPGKDLPEYQGLPHAKRVAEQ
jgi:hypothetical protein